MLQPGLEFQEIESEVKDLNLSLPLEFYELYQWRNGVEYGNEGRDNIFFGLSFHSLEQALDLYEDFLDLASEKRPNSEDEIWSPKWFPLFSCDGESLFTGEFICVLSDRKNQKTSPLVRVWYEAAEAFVQFNSLNSMIRTLVDSYESGACHISKRNSISVDEYKVNKIYRKYNNVLDFLYPGSMPKKL